MKKSKTPLTNSFKSAFLGIKEILRIERNFQIHILIGFLVILIAFLLGISKNDSIIIFLIIGMVLAVEIINSGFELMFDILHPHNLRSKEQDLAVQVIKDMLAGAVLIVVIAATVIGILIFYPYVLNLILG